MLDITIVTIGRLKEKCWREAADEYLKRLGPYARIETVELEAASFSNSNQEKAKEIEFTRIDKFLSKKKDHNIYLLAEKGINLDSIEFANWLNREQPVILVIGGALGFSQKLYDSYPQISLSILTFPHELARVVLLEQIYRASTILNNKQYHY